MKQELKTEKYEERKKNSKQESYIVPTFYNRINLKETSLLVTFRSDGIFKLNKMKVNLDTFSKEKKFYSRTALIDRLFWFVRGAALKGFASHAVLCFAGDSKKEEEVVRVKNSKNNLKALLGGDY